jgi:SAM-dependent methyltransferase
MTDTDQDSIFFEREGDAYFSRRLNSRCSKDPREISARDFPLRIIDTLGLRPERVLEVGAAEGERLAEISRRFGGKGKYVAVEPSLEATKYGQDRYPFISFRRGLMCDLPLENEETFDLVIVNFAFHWVPRNHLMRSVSEIDRAVVDGGFLIIGDFLPDFPSKVRYHHLPDERSYTYKQDYAKIFLASQMYSCIAPHTFNRNNHATEESIASDNRCVCPCLQKNQEGLYLARTLQENR